MSVRPPAVAGLFYPDDPQHLARAVADYLAGVEPEGAAPEAGPEAVPKAIPKAIVVPHAGFVYSAPVAASAYARLRPLKGRLSRVVLIGPAHRVAMRGLAAPRAEAFDTPLGRLPVDREAVARIAALPQVTLNDEPHRLEHCLEVQLPFIIACLGIVPLVPLVVGDASAKEVAEVVEMLWDGPETLVVISSDLSHYHDYETARRMDAATSAAIEALDESKIGWDDACGRIPIAGLLKVARARGLKARTLDLRNSGDTAGPKNEVVGYGAYAFA
ncbi:MAG: AmmeMemoRadiSam system protein B [Alphaproteobacteria bacterium]